jgi:hypothetical protein
MKQSPTRVLLIILFVFLGCFGVAYAAAGMLTALPAPAIGGTCGPSTASETATEALLEPGSIGAGPVPPASNTTAVHQRQTFIHQCQSLADRRGMASLAILVISLVVSGAGLFWVLRKPRSEDDDEATDGEGQGQPSYAPLGLNDPGALVGAGAVVGAPAAIATWPPAPQPGYGPPPGYPGQPMAPPYPSGYPDPGYPQQAWPQQPPPYQSAPQQPFYPQAPAYPPPAYPQAPQAPIAPQAPPAPPAVVAIAHPAPEAPVDPSESHAPIPLPAPDTDSGGPVQGPGA